METLSACKLVGENKSAPKCNRHNHGVHRILTILSVSAVAFLICLGAFAARSGDKQKMTRVAPAAGAHELVAVKAKIAPRGKAKLKLKARPKVKAVVKAAPQPVVPAQQTHGAIGLGIQNSVFGAEGGRVTFREVVYTTAANGNASVAIILRLDNVSAEFSWAGRFSLALGSAGGKSLQQPRVERGPGNSMTVRFSGIKGTDLNPGKMVLGFFPPEDEDGFAILLPAGEKAPTSSTDAAAPIAG